MIVLHVLLDAAPNALNNCMYTYIRDSSSVSNIIIGWMKFLHAVRILHCTAPKRDGKRDEAKRGSNGLELE